MGIRNKERRQAKARDRKRRARGRATNAAHDHCPHCASPDPGDTIDEVAREALLSIGLGESTLVDEIVRELADTSATGGRLTGLVDTVLVRLVHQLIAGAWLRGWQPADVVRLVQRRDGGLPALLATHGIAAELRNYAPATVDDRFWGQLTVLGADPELGEAADFVARWAERTGTDRAAVIRGVLELGHVLLRLPSLPRLCPPPGKASRATRDGRGTVDADPRVLEKVRALLAKAESSDFGAEAEAFTAKAQELMARHSIDHALLAMDRANVAEPSGIRVGLDSPYEAEKALLLDQVATANRCRAVWSRELGFVTVLGFPTDLRAVDLLFTSLLVQATRAVVRAGPRRTAWGGSRTRTFRLSFLRAFATRIGERLRGVTEAGVRDGAASDARLLPVLAGRDHSVGTFTDALFPTLTHRATNRAYDREGWALGTTAADLTPLTGIPSLTDDARPSPAVPFDARAIQEPLFPVPAMH